MPSACSASIKIFLLATLVVLTACSGGRQQGNALLPYADTSWQQLDSGSYQAAVRRINRIIDYRLPADPQQRELGPIAVIPTDDGAAVLIARSSAVEVVVARVNASGVLNYRQEISLVVDGASPTVKDVELVELKGISTPSIKISFSSDGGIASIYYTLSVMQPQLLRAESATGDLVNRALATSGLATAIGDLSESADRASQLAATAHLAQQGQPATDNAVISHLQRLSSGNDIWLAQAAADLLTLR